MGPSAPADMGPGMGMGGPSDYEMSRGGLPAPQDSHYSHSHQWEAEFTLGNFTLDNDGFRLPSRLTPRSDPPDPLRMKKLSSRSLVRFHRASFPDPGAMMGGDMGEGMMDMGDMPGMELAASGRYPHSGQDSLINITTNLFEEEVIRFPVESVLDSRALVSLKSTLNVADGESVVLPWYGSIGVIREHFLAQGVDPLLIIHGVGERGADRNRSADLRPDGSPAISEIRGPLRIERLQCRTDDATNEFVEQIGVSTSEVFPSSSTVQAEPEYPPAPTTASVIPVPDSAGGASSKTAGRRSQSGGDHRSPRETPSRRQAGRTGGYFAADRRTGAALAGTVK